MEKEEYITVLNADGTSTGKTCPKSEIHIQGHYHDTAHIWFYNVDAEILLAQRAASKTVYPLLWDVSVAGHVDAGEIIEDAAIRETQEEIGIEISIKDLEKIGVYKCFKSYPDGIKDNEFHHTYISETKCTLKDLKLDTDEVAHVKFVSIHEFKDLLKNSDSNSHFVSSNTSYYLDVMKAIENSLLNKKA
jgi:isopentenyl-diphosphate delta-isomerase